AARPTSASSSPARRSRSRRPRVLPSIGTCTFSSAVSVAIRLWNWNTKPTVCARYAARSPSRSTRRAPTWIEPPSGRSSAPIRLSSVDLPQPDGPVSATNSPGARRSETSSSARIRPPSKLLLTCSTTTSAPATSADGNGNDLLHRPAARPDDRLEVEGLSPRRGRPRDLLALRLAPDADDVPDPPLVHLPNEQAAEEDSVRERRPK